MWQAELLNTVLGTLSSGVPPVPPGSYESIASAAGTGSSGTITFSSIPATYASLQIRFSYKASVGGESVLMQFNSDTGSNYTRHRLVGNGSAASASAFVPATSLYVGDANSASDTTYCDVCIIDIHDYASTTKNKTERHFQGLDKNGSGSLSLASGLWINTSAITTISIFLTSGNFTTDSQFALYGVKG